MCSDQHQLQAQLQMVSNALPFPDQSKKDPYRRQQSAPSNQSRCGLQYLLARPIQFRRIQTCIQYLPCALNSATTSLLDDRKHEDALD